MGSNMNFKGFSDSKSSGDSFEKPMESFPLTRQPSIYSLTFGEFQNTLGDVGKDFGSMNMDELLKNIWTAEETQAIMYNNNNNISNTNNNSLVVGGGGGGGAFPGVNLQRQGSFTLPRTLSQKTVDEVWRDLMRDGDNGSGGTSAPQRQQTLGEMTLEEFLVRAGVVREEPQQIARPSNGNAGYYGYNNTNASLAQNNALLGSTPPIPNCSPGLALTAGGIRAALPPSQQQQQQQQQLRPLQLQQQSEPVFPKHATVAFANPMNLMNGAQLTTQVPRTSVVGIGDRSMNNNLVQAGGLKNEGVCMLDLRNGVTVAAASPGSQISPDVMSKSNKDAASLSPAPFLFGRGRRSSAALEKVIERRQRRMIKNRESAARSRARKQAYTLELEAEVAKLKELNEELQRKQAEIMEMQKDQLLEPMRRRWGCKRQCLRRTLTGPW